MAPEATTDVGEERPGVGHTLAHRGVAHAEQQQGDTDHEVSAWGGRTVAEHDGYWHGAGHSDQGSGGRYDEEYDSDGAESTLVERSVLVGIGSGGVLGNCHCDTPH